MSTTSLLAQLDHLNAQQLRRLLVEHLTQQKLGLYWEANAIERDAAISADLVFPRLQEATSHALDEAPTAPHLIIEGDNFDSLRLLNATHRGKVRVIYIDPPYNTGNKDWVYNDHYVGANDRWRHSQWLEFLFRRLTLARDLLTPDGVIMLSINDENRSRLELLMDEVMPGRRIGSFVWKTRQGSNDAKGAFFSPDHEHVLIYANQGFRFSGMTRTFQTYSNSDNDPNGDWSSDTLSCAKNYIERPNLYYPVQDPDTGIYYPCNPERVWVYSTEKRLLEGQVLRAKTMEQFIVDGRVLFPITQRVEIWRTTEELLAAIDSGDVPGSGSTKMLRRDLPNIEFWVGKRVGFGRPRFKRYKADLANDTKPVSSWFQSSAEKNIDAEDGLIAGSNQEGARDILRYFGSKVFNYTKPLSLIKGLLAQATRPNDIVLDFFAGSGTTGQAVLELNAEDGGQRRFILCSSTEATAKEPEKNLCRDVCAERLRRVMQGYGNKPALGGQFAYLQLDKFEVADVEFDATPAHAAQLLSLRYQQAAIRPSQAKVQLIASDGQVAVVLCSSVDEDSIAQLLAWPCERLVVYSARPATVQNCLAQAGKSVISYSLHDALLRGQSTLRAASR